MQQIVTSDNFVFLSPSTIVPDVIQEEDPHYNTCSNERKRK